MQNLIETALRRLAEAKEFSACAELRRLAIELICANVLGLPPGAQTEAMTKEYGILLPGLIAVPVAVPGGTYSRALAAREYRREVGANVARLGQLGAYALTARARELDSRVLETYSRLRAQRRI